jgi:dihydrolipoamide dehydrogenase
MVSRSRDVASGMSRGIEYLFKKMEFQSILGMAKLVRPKSRSCFKRRTSTQLEPEYVIATGSRANSLPFAPIDGKEISLIVKPLFLKYSASMVVIGSELSEANRILYRSLGSEVTLIEYLDSIVPLEDEEVSAQLSRSFRKMGIKILTSARVNSVEKNDSGCKIEVLTKKGTEYIEAEKVLSAVGVVANVENLGLENCGVVVERGKVRVDSFYSTNVEGIYAIGDVIATPALAHIASAEAICCVEKIAGLDPKPLDYNNFPACTYTSPNCICRMTEKASRNPESTIKSGNFRLQPQARQPHQRKRWFCKAYY